MRTIKFRAKRVDNKEWIEGYYVLKPNGKHFIYWKPFEEATQHTYHEVIPETVIQFTGEIDRDKNEIYERYFVKLGAEKEVYRVKFHAGCFMLYNKDKQMGLLGELKMCFIKVIGNVFDNPELL